MKISIIIPTYNREQVLCDTITSVLDTIASTKTNDSFELIIVDQTKVHSDNVAWFLSGLHKDNKINYIYEEVASLPNARNVGIVNSTGEIICFLDDDVKLTPDFFYELISVFKTKDTDALAGRVTLVNEGGNLLLGNQNRIKDLARRILIRLLCKGKVFSISSLGFVLSDTDCLSSMYVDAARGCNMAFRRSVFETVGMFDVSYRGNALREETDLFYRMKQRGLKVFYHSKVHLYHIMSNTGGCRNDISEKYWSTYFFNQCYFYIKNYGFSLKKIKLILIFDYLKCERLKIGIDTILSEQYSSAQKILSQYKFKKTGKNIC